MLMASSGMKMRKKKGPGFALNLDDGKHGREAVWRHLPSDYAGKIESRYGSESCGHVYIDFIFGCVEICHSLIVVGECHVEDQTLYVEGEVVDNVSICQRAYEPMANVYAIALPHLIEYLMFGYDSIRVDGAAVGEDEVRHEGWREVHRIRLIVLNVFVGRYPTQIDIDFDVEGVVRDVYLAYDRYVDAIYADCSRIVFGCRW